MWGGQLLPVASTGISSYFSKFIPVLPPAKSSLKIKERKEMRFHKRSGAMATQKQLKVGSSALLFQALVGGRALGPVFVSGVLPPAVAAAAAAATAEASALVSVRVQTSALISLRALMGKASGYTSGGPISKQQIVCLGLCRRIQRSRGEPTASS